MCEWWRNPRVKWLDLDSAERQQNCKQQQHEEPVKPSQRGIGGVTVVSLQVNLGHVHHEWTRQGWASPRDLQPLMALVGSDVALMLVTNLPGSADVSSTKFRITVAS